MKSKILSLFIFCVLGSTIASCIYGTCNPVSPYFEIQGIKSSNLIFISTGSNPWEHLEENESINWTNFFTRFSFESISISAIQSNYGGTLMATTCEEPGWAGDKIGVDTVIVKTVFDYNENYAAGSVINDIIVTNSLTVRARNFDEFVPLENYLAENSEGVRDQTFELKLIEAPSTSTTFSFDITYKLNNGVEFQHRTVAVNLTK